MASNDVFTEGAAPGVPLGDTVVLTAGTLTPTSNFADTPPASAAYSTFIFATNGIRLDAVGGVAGPTVVPEPSTWALLGVGVVGLGLTLRRRSAHA